jgi:hypothetical protein
MQIKGSTYAIFGTYQILPNLHFASPLAKQNKTKNKFKARNISPLSWERRLYLAYATSLLNI